MPVTVTEIAARRIEQIIQEHGFDPASMKLRVGVKGGGCSGFNYTLDLTEVQKDSDESWNFTYARGASASANEGGGTATATAGGDTFTVTVVCDPKSYLYLNGTTIDLDLRLRKQLQRVIQARSAPTRPPCAGPDSIAPAPPRTRGAVFVCWRCDPVRITTPAFGPQSGIVRLSCVQPHPDRPRRSRQGRRLR